MEKKRLVQENNPLLEERDLEEETDQTEARGKVTDLGSETKGLSPEKEKDQTLEIRETRAEEGDIEENHLLILGEIEGLQEKSPLIQIIEMNQQVGERIIKMIEEERKDQEEKGTEESKHFQERKCHHW